MIRKKMLGSGRQLSEKRESIAKFVPKLKNLAIFSKFTLIRSVLDFITAGFPFILGVPVF
jgi:hypothetical protein